MAMASLPGEDKASCIIVQHAAATDVFDTCADLYKYNANALGNRPSKAQGLEFVLIQQLLLFRGAYAFLKFCLRKPIWPCMACHPCHSCRKVHARL